MTPSSITIAQNKPSDDDAIPRQTRWPVAESLAYFHHAWLLRTGAEERLRTAPTSPVTVRWLVRAGRVGDALTTIRRIVEERPELMAEAFDAIDGFEHLLQFDAARGHVEQARELVEDTRKRLPDLPRELQAAVTRAMIGLEWQADRSVKAAERLSRLVKTFDGTQAAIHARLDLVTFQGVSPDVFSAFDEFVAKYPGTEIAARAIYSRAFHLSRNATAFGVYNTGSDVEDRFFEVLKAVNELQSGRYPPSRWVREAPQLVTGFDVRTVKPPAESAGRILASSLEFVRANLALADDANRRQTFLYFLAEIVPKVVAMTTDGAAAIDPMFDQLERSVPNPAFVRFAKARHRLSPLAQPPLSPEERKSAERILDSVGAMGTGPYSEWALAEVAEIDYRERRFEMAQGRFTTLLQRYPTSDLAWAVAIRIGQTEAALGRHDEAARRFAEASKRGASLPLAMVIASAYAGRALEAAGRFDEALARYRDSFRSWNNFPDLVGATGGYSAERIARAERDPAYVSRGEIERRIDQLSTSLSVPGGLDLERGRNLMHQGRNSEAVAILEPLVRKVSTTPVGAEAVVVLHRARLEEAIALVDTANAAPDSLGALKILDALSQQPFDSSVALASIAAATIRRLQGDTVTADGAMHDALRRWVATSSKMQPPAKNSVEADALEIRDAVFLPLGKGLLAEQWNAQHWPQKLPVYLIAPSELRVKLAAADVVHRVNVSRQPIGLTNVAFLSSDNVEYLTRLVPRLGGIRRREPAAIMEVPNQPLGDARAIIQWWNGFFPAQPGHWSGYEVLTYPAFTSIEFTNHERTRALVPVRVGYSGATIVLEKVNGAWMMKEVVNYWVT